MPPRTARLIILLAFSLLAAPLAAEAPKKVVRIGILSTGNPRSAPHWHAFDQRLHELGYVDGHTIAIEFRNAEGSAEQLRDLAAELVRLPVEVLVAGSSAVTKAAQQATRTIPIVTAGSGDPVGLGFVASLAQPGGNITGMSNFVAALPGKQLELLSVRVAVPRAWGLCWPLCRVDARRSPRAL